MARSTLFRWLTRPPLLATPSLAGAGVGFVPPGIPSYRQAIPLLDVEFRRARRYEHPMAILLLRPDVGESPPEEVPTVTRPPLPHFPSLGLGYLLRDTLRETDLLMYVGDDGVYGVVLPETDRAAALHALRRISATFTRLGGTELRVGMAVFPQDGLTVQALVDRAREAQITLVDSTSKEVRHA